MMTLSWPWPILQQGQIWSLLLLYGKMLKLYISENLLKPVRWKLLHIVVTYSQTDNYMTIYYNPRSRSFIYYCPRSLRFNIFKLLFLKNLQAIEAKFHMEPPWDVGNENLFKCCKSYDQIGFQTRIWKKPSKISFFQTKKPMTLKLGIQYWVLKYFQICSNDDPQLTLTIFMTVKFVS